MRASVVSFSPPRVRSVTRALASKMELHALGLHMISRYSSSSEASVSCVTDAGKALSCYLPTLDTVRWLRRQAGGTK